MLVDRTQISNILASRDLVWPVAELGSSPYLCPALDCGVNERLLHGLWDCRAAVHAALVVRAGGRSRTGPAASDD
jgi:hypothetical protein